MDHRHCRQTRRQQGHHPRSCAACEISSHPPPPSIFTLPQVQRHANVLQGNLDAERLAFRDAGTAVLGEVLNPLQVAGLLLHGHGGLPDLLRCGHARVAAGVSGGGPGPHARTLAWQFRVEADPTMTLATPLFPRAAAC